jgi:hypothetical protein
VTEGWDGDMSRLHDMMECESCFPRNIAGSDGDEVCPSCTGLVTALEISNDWNVPPREFPIIGMLKSVRKAAG